MRYLRAALGHLHAVSLDDAIHNLLLVHLRVRRAAVRVDLPQHNTIRPHIALARRHLSSMSMHRDAMPLCTDLARDALGGGPLDGELAEIE